MCIYTFDVWMSKCAYMYIYFLKYINKSEGWKCYYNK